MKNNKIILIAIIVILIIITAIIVFKSKENNSEEISQQGNEITKKEYNDNLIENIVKKLSNVGIEIRQNERTRFKRLEGNRYVVLENGEQTEKTFEMYTINLKEKTQILGKNTKNGKVTIDEKTQGILSGNLLIVNITDEKLSNQIKETLNL